MDNQYPRLELYFSTEGGRLEYASFFEDSPGTANHELANRFTNGKYARAICILIVLAKYHGVDIENPDKPIPIRERTDRSSWLSALSFFMNRETTPNILKECFGNVVFFSAKRATPVATANPKRQTLGLPVAQYFNHALPLKNVSIFKGRQTNPKVKPDEYTGKELAKLALELEAVELGEDKSAWQAAVSEMQTEIDLGRSTVKPSLSVSDERDVTDRKIREIIKEQPWGKYWLIAHENNKYLTYLNPLFENVMLNGSTLWLIHRKAESVYYGEGGYGPPDFFVGKAIEWAERRAAELKINNNWSIIHDTPDDKSFLFEGLIFVPGNSENLTTVREGAWAALHLDINGPITVFVDYPNPLLQLLYAKTVLKLSQTSRS